MGQRQTRTYRTIVILFTLLVAVSLIVMALVRKSSEVDISLKVGHLSLKTDDERAKDLFNSVKTNHLAVSAFKEITLGDGVLYVTDEMDSETAQPINWRRVDRPANDSHVLTPQETFSNVKFEKVVLNRLDVASGATWKFDWLAEEPGAVKLSFDKAVVGEIAGESTMQFSCTGCRIQDDPSTDAASALHFRLTSRHDGGNIIYLAGIDNATIIGLDLPPETKLKEQSIALTDDISFTKGGGGRDVSTVIEGKYKFEGVGEEANVGEGVFVTLDDLKKATLRTIVVDKGISITLHGTVGKLMTGDEGHKINRNPTLLEWVAAKHVWILVVEALMVIVPTFLGVLGWWQGPRKERTA